MLKEFDNLLVLMMFNETEEDKQTGVAMAKELYKVVDRKELTILK